MQTHEYTVILVRTSHPGNIGACARAMKTMGITELRLVNTVSEKDQVAYSRSSGAEDLLYAAQHFQSLEEAVKDCHYVWGTSARKRSDKGQEATCLTQLPKIIDTLSGQKRIALVFGNEQNGLDNHELGLCHRQIIVPTNPQFSSLNIASCVQLVSFVAMQQASDEKIPESPENSAASHAQIEAMTQTLTALAFNKNPEKASLDAIKLRQLFFRMSLNDDEVNFIHGVLKRYKAKCEAK